MPYKMRRTIEFREKYRDIIKKNKSLKPKIDEKIQQIAASPTTTGKPKKGNLKYTRGAHVAGNFVIMYMIIDDNIIFLYVDRHDSAYKEAPKVLGNIEFDFPELWAVMSPDLKRHLKQ
jgi:addiction module RelE/StbE family toxin